VLYSSVSIFDSSQFQLCQPRYIEIETTTDVSSQCEVFIMFMDEVVFSGLAIVGLTCAFFVGVYIAVKKDIKKHGTGE
tara:strand:- start:11 stop:244 length:234 start_codon:yes stop_codon:yes gene_type:complete